MQLEQKMKNFYIKCYDCGEKWFAGISEAAAVERGENHMDKFGCGDVELLEVEEEKEIEEENNS